MSESNDPGFTMHLVCCESVILNEIKQGLNQKQIAQTYRMSIASDQAGAWKVDWRTINNAIVERWSPRGLERVKNLAWSGKCFERKGATS